MVPVSIIINGKYSRKKDIYLFYGALVCVFTLIHPPSSLISINVFVKERLEN